MFSCYFASFSDFVLLSALIPVCAKNCIFINSCSMTLCFSFDVLIKLNPIQVNIEGDGPS